MTKQIHAHRVVAEDGPATCECGAEFADDNLWRAHYEKSHDEKERMKLENRDPAGDKKEQEAFEKVHQKVLEAQ